MRSILTKEMRAQSEPVVVVAAEQRLRLLPVEASVPVDVGHRGRRTQAPGKPEKPARAALEKPLNSETPRVLRMRRAVPMQSLPGETR